MSKITIIEGNNNEKDNVRVIMVKGEKGDKGEQGDLNSSQIVDNLTTDDSSKMLSAKQGKILKDLVDENQSYAEENFSTKTELDNEKSAREIYDENLQSQISSLSSGSPLVASSTSGMTDTTRIYVNTTDGYWYYYNGSSWVTGGVYQAYNNPDFDSLKNNVENLNNVNTILDIDFEQGRIAQTTGQEVDDNNYIRSKETFDTIDYRYIYFKDATIRAIIVWYDANGDYTGNVSVVATNGALPTTYPKFRIVIASKTSGTPVVPAEGKGIIVTNYTAIDFSNKIENDIKILFDNTEKTITVKSVLPYLIIKGRYIYKTINQTIDYPSVASATYNLVYNIENDTIECINVPAYTTNQYVKLCTFVLPSSTIVETIINHTYSTFIDNIIYDKSKFINMSIIGDSYSTYKDWIKSGNTNWYPYADLTDNDVDSVTKTWWYKMMKSLKCNLLIDDAYGGSTICNTVKPGHTIADSFISRMVNSLGKNRASETKPDLIFIFGGTNDFWNDSPIGTVQYSSWTDNDLLSVLPAFCYMIDYIKLWNPTATIVNVVNDILSTDIKQGMATACQHYNIINVQLSSIDKMSNHPSIAGMQQIQEQILEKMF